MVIGGEVAKKTPTAYAHEFTEPDEQQIAHWAVEVRHGSRLPTLRGSCPSCNHECVVDILDIAIQGGLPAGASEAGPATLTRQIICNCRNEHQQPPGVRGGCGRYWLAELSREDDASYRLGVQKNVRLLSAATALNDIQQSQDKNIQDAAERWIGLVSIIYGLFSLAGIVAAGSILSGLDAASKSLIGFALAIALFAAGGALFAGYLAAYGWPTLAPVKNDRDLENWYIMSQTYSIAAVKRLREAIVLAFISFGSLSAVMLLVWFLPRQHT
jgi:hypothetical protein